MKRLTAGGCKKLKRADDGECDINDEWPRCNDDDDDDDDDDADDVDDDDDALMFYREARCLWLCKRTVKQVAREGHSSDMFYSH